MKLGSLQCCIRAVTTVTYTAIDLTSSSKDKMYDNADFFEGWQRHSSPQDSWA